MSSRFTWDTHELAFSTDITPSPYYALGHRPIENGELFGRPLFAETSAERQSYLHSDNLIVSSYGPTYGIVSDGGRRLFIVDASAHKNYQYDLTSDPEGLRNVVNTSSFAANEGTIRKLVRELAKAYNYGSDAAGR